MEVGHEPRLGAHPQPEMIRDARAIIFHRIFTVVIGGDAYNGRSRYTTQEDHRPLGPPRDGFNGKFLEWV